MPHKCCAGPWVIVAQMSAHCPKCCSGLASATRWLRTTCQKRKSLIWDPMWTEHTFQQRNTMWAHHQHRVHETPRLLGWAIKQPPAHAAPPPAPLYPGSTQEHPVGCQQPYIFRQAASSARCAARRSSRSRSIAATACATAACGAGAGSSRNHSWCSATSALSRSSARAEQLAAAPACSPLGSVVAAQPAALAEPQHCRHGVRRCGVCGARASFGRKHLWCSAASAFSRSFARQAE